MFVWGTKIKRQRKGVVAEYCPICRLPRAMEANELRAAGHVYWIAPFAGKRVGIEVQCPDCGFENAIGLEYYKEFTEDAEYSIDLARATTPVLVGWIKGRAEIERRVYGGYPKEGERLMLIWEVVATLDYMAENMKVSLESEDLKGMFLYGLPLVPLPIVILFLGAPPAVAMGFLITSVLLLFGFLFVKSRKLEQVHRQVVMSLLARGLTPLDPTREELEQVGVGSGQSPLFKKLKVDKIVQAIEESLSEYRQSNVESI